ncbi:MAG: tetraacyldisaccharide 4'-kinase [Bacteroidales bacterium]|jgi:tetraacyldisaccharide 4'-kinase|nr:tetraacyldisaccharide 4'-kinase [Bacteroidales bacterium]
MYSIITSIRNFLFDRGILLHEKTFEIPVISVGNLEMGGTGKTPMVEYLVRRLGAHGEDYIGIVTRGYGRKTSNPLLAVATSTADDIGDEPLQYLQEFGNKISLYIDSNRVRGISNLIRLKPQTNIIILDDAFQHRYVKPSLNILLTTFNRPFFSDYTVPFGRLRENKSGAKRADIIVVTKCPVTMTESEAQEICKKINPLENQKIFFTTLEYEVPSSESKNIILLTGIAHPKPLVKYLQQEGFIIEQHLNYPDHHNYNAKEVANLMNIKYPIFTTQKDKTKLPDIPNIHAVKIAHRFLFNGAEEFENSCKIT